MFTGIISDLGSVGEITRGQAAVRFKIITSYPTDSIKIGESIACNGCCLTVIGNNADTLTFEAGEETLRRTTFSDLQPNDVGNLERSLRVGDELGGHWVTGHIDTVGTITQRNDQGDWSEIWCEVPPEFTSQLVSKGSVAMDGVSLTVVKVVDCQFSVALIPHTLSLTTLGDRQAGDRMNIETDILAKYVERQLQSN